jgi:putative endonuclease
MANKRGYVYIMTSVDNTVLYTGVTSDLRLRYQQHITGRYATAFTAKYHCHKLVYYQEYGSIEEAIAEEKRIKGGSRKKTGRFDKINESSMARLRGVSNFLNPIERIDSQILE